MARPVLSASAVAIAVAAVALSGCRPTIPDDVFACERTDECPASFTCVSGFCRRATEVDSGPGRDGGDGGRDDAGASDASAARCTDGRREGTEGCDDGNSSGGDGCSADCMVEPGWSCTEPSAGVPNTCRLCGWQPEACETSSTCGPDRVCLRGACVDGCGGTDWLTALDADLEPSVRILGAFCPSAGKEAMGVVKVVRDGCEGLDGLAVAARRSTLTQAAFELVRFPLEPGAPRPVVTSVASTGARVEDGSVTVYVSDFLAVNPAGTRAVFGYTTSQPGFPGALVHVRLSDGTIYRTDASGNYDAVWADDATLLVEAQYWNSLTAPGVYALGAGEGAFVGFDTLVSDFGTYNGSLALLRARGALLVGDTSTPWPDNTAGGRFFGLPLERLFVDGAPGPAVSAYSDPLVPRFRVGASAFEVVGNNYLGVSGSFDNWVWQTLEGTSAGDITLGDAIRRFASRNLVQSIVPIDGRRALLVLEGGLVVVDLER